MKRYGKELEESQKETTLADFLESYNKTIPASFPKATVILLKKFKDAHALLFKRGDKWSLDQHRKKIMDWLPRNLSDF